MGNCLISYFGEEKNLQASINTRGKRDNFYNDKGIIKHITKTIRKLQEYSQLNLSLLGIVLLGGNKMQADEFVLKRIEELSKKYQETWGKEVDYTIVPQGITQERLTKCLELMIKDNLSLMIAYNKLFKKQEHFSEKGFKFR